MFRRSLTSCMMAAAVAPDLALQERFLARQSNIIEPTWWTGTPAVDPSTFTIDCTQLQKGGGMFQAGTSDVGDNFVVKPEIAAELGGRMNDTYNRTGLVYLNNTGLGAADLPKMRQLAKLVMKKEMLYKGGSNNRGGMEKNVYDVGAPLEAWLHYHHEMAYVNSSTQMIGFLCKRALPAHRALYGSTFLSDSVQATEALLKTDLGKKLKDLGVCYHRDMTDRDHFAGRVEEGVYNHWQKSMLTEDPDEAVATAHSRGLKTSWGPNRLLKTRYYISAFEYFPGTDKNLLYCSVADDGMWFDSWPMVQHLPNDERPLRLTFGDDSVMSQEEKQQFVTLYDKFGLPAAWQPGDVCLLCNYRWAHGRPSIELQAGEKRELGVMIGEPFDRVGDRPGKW